MNMKLNDALQQQEELRLQESQDFLYAMNAVEQELHDACDKNIFAERTVGELKQQLIILQEKLTEHQVRKDEHDTKADAMEDKLRTLTEYTRELEYKLQLVPSTSVTSRTKGKGKADKPALGQYNHADIEGKTENTNQKDL